MMFRNLMRVCCYAPSPTQPGGSILGRPMRRKRFKDVRLPNNPEALCFSQLQDQTHIRITGHAKGQQGYIEECKACKIFIFGDCASLMVVNCSDCFIHVASVDGSVLMRNCRSCRCSFCCRQFRGLYGYLNNLTQQIRTYDCRCGLDAWTAVLCLLQKGMSQQNQSMLVVGKTDEVGSMKVSTWSTRGTDVHDFTPDSSTQHWTCLPERLQDEQSRVAGKGDNRRDTCFVCFMERDAALAYAYVVVAVWKDVCVVGMSTADYVNKSILKGFVHSLGPLMNSDERTWLRALIAAKAIVMEIAGADCICTWQHTVQELGNEKSHYFMTKHCGMPGQSQCSYYAGNPSSEDNMGGSRCQVLLQKLLGFAASNQMDLNQIIETSASS